MVSKWSFQAYSQVFEEAEAKSLVKRVWIQQELEHLLLFILSLISCIGVPSTRMKVGKDIYMQTNLEFCIYKGSAALFARPE